MAKAVLSFTRKTLSSSANQHRIWSGSTSSARPRSGISKALNYTCIITHMILCMNAFEAHLFLAGFPPFVGSEMIAQTAHPGLLFLSRALCDLIYRCIRPCDRRILCLYPTGAKQKLTPLHHTSSLNRAYLERRFYGCVLYDNLPRLNSTPEFGWLKWIGRANVKRLRNLRICRHAIFSNPLFDTGYFVFWCIKLYHCETSMASGSESRGAYFAVRRDTRSVTELAVIQSLQSIIIVGYCGLYWPRCVTGNVSLHA